MSSVEDAFPVDGQVDGDHLQGTEPPLVETPQPTPLGLPEIEENISESILFPNTSQEELDSPPAYEAGGRLIRTTPTKGGRYNLRRRRARTSHRPIPPGPIDGNSPNDRVVPAGWHKMVHPEGQLYFYQPSHRLVTEAYLYERLVFVKITFWLERVSQLLAAQHMTLPLSSELFLELDEETNSCKYYFVDHGTRMLFWLDGGRTDDLDLPPVSSDDHLKILLEEQYWNHVEYFPNHIKLSPSVEFEVRGILTHSAADSFTSEQSTAPYTLEQCQSFLNLIGNLPTTPETNSYKNCVIARLMAEFNSNRFTNHAGEQSARLSRTQTLLEDPDIRTPWTFKVAFRLCFNYPTENLEELDTLWVDEISFSSHWRKFISRRVAAWRETGTWGFAMALLHAAILLIRDGSLSEKLLVKVATSICRLSGVIAETLAIGCAFVSVAMVQRHRNFIDSHAVDASAYLGAAKHPTYGFQPLAIIHSVPQALLQWTFITTCFVLLSMPWRFDSLTIGILSYLLIASVFIGIYSVRRQFNVQENASWLVTTFSWFLRFRPRRVNDYEIINDNETV